jgi:hypothetical protein
MAASKAKPRKKPKKRALDARPDTVDFRDQIFVATLVEVPSERPLAAYKREYKRATGHEVPILNQGEEGACTGFGLAALCNYLLGTRAIGARAEAVSPRMLYEMAKRYDEWQGDDYDGSSARGAMKGWHRHGVCSETIWPYKLDGSTRKDVDDATAKDASKRPLGAYFRVNHKDLVAMHAALSEVGILYVTGNVHDGWDKVSRKTGIIPHHPGTVGGHAYAIVGYDEQGFWIQNSWGKGWGLGGFGHMTYDDWLDNGYDAWVARLGAPIYREGKRNLGVTVGGLETAQEQLMLFETLDASTQRTLLTRAAEKSDGAVKEVVALTNAWGRGDVAALEKVINEDVDAAPAARQAIITDRNRRWSAWVKRRMDQPGTVLMAVGAGHLVGADGVPAMLEAEGMKVQRVQ